MKENGYDFIFATLGKNENKKTFIENQTGIYPKIEEQNLISIKEIANLNKRLDETFELKKSKSSF